MNFRGLFLLVALLGATLSLPACGEWIYDDREPIADPTIGDGWFSDLEASSYLAWVYVDLETPAVFVVNEYEEGNTDQPPAKWHFAMHRYDCKTNGGEVLETGYSSIAELLDAGAIPPGDFVADAFLDGKVAIDMSGMMDDNIIYADSDYNTEFSKWMNLDTSIMPPIYTPSNKVYVVRMEDGTMAAVRFTQFFNAAGIKGYISGNYLYPLEF